MLKCGVVDVSLTSMLLSIEPPLDTFLKKDRFFYVGTFWTMFMGGPRSGKVDQLGEFGILPFSFGFA